MASLDKLHEWENNEQKRIIRMSRYEYQTLTKTGNLSRTSLYDTGELAHKKGQPSQQLTEL